MSDPWGLYYRLVICYSRLLKMAMEIVDVPMKNDDFPKLC